MGKILKWLTDRLIVQLALNLIVYILHWVVIAAALTPGMLFLIWSWGKCFPAGELSIPSAFTFSMAIMIAYFIFIVSGVLLFGLFIRFISFGFKEGVYEQFSWTMIRWLILSGVYNFACDAILPRILISPLLNAFFRGKSTLSCHIFERGRLVLKSIKIGKNCVVGAHAYLHPGVIMEDNSAVGVYALVPKNTTIRSKTVHGHLPAMSYRELARLSRFAKSERASGATASEKPEKPEKGAKDGTN